MSHELTVARALRDQMHRAMKACTTELEQASVRLDETLARLSARYPADDRPTCPSRAP